MRRVTGTGVAARHLKLRSFVTILWLVLMCGSELPAQQQALTLPSQFHFDGSSYITLANSRALQPTSQVTITAWVKPDFSVSNVQDTILDKRDGCGFNRSYQLSVIKTFQDYTPGTIFFAASNANTDDLFSTTSVPNDGKFHHVAGTYDGTTTKVFLDGALVGQGTHTGSISVTTDPAVIGIQAGCGDPTYADIDQVKIFNYAVPDAQIMSETSGFALLNGGNSFVGNQMVNGTVTATNFVGSGSGLAGVTASTLNCAACVSNVQLGVNYAGSTSQGGAAISAVSAVQANNALALGGISPSNYARFDVGNDFTGNQHVGGSVSASGNLSVAGTTTIGGGTPIVEYVSTALNVNLPALTAGSCTTFTSAALTGYTPGTSDTIALGVPSDLISLSKVFVIWQAWETSNSASPTITVQVCNPSAARYAGGAADTIRIDIFKH